MTVHRRGSRTLSIYTEVEIDKWEALEALTDEDLLEEVEQRKLEPKKEEKPTIDALREAAIDALDMLARGDVADAELLLTRTLYPKFQSVASCAEQLEQLKARR